ncbi:MAG: phytanoyl-CoA dioxygenase family protein [Acidimicrobiales bacterium]
MSRLDRVASSGPGSRLVAEPIAGWGYRRHLVDDETPRLAYQAMRKLYGAPTTRGFDALAARAAAEDPRLDLPGAADGIVGGQVDALVRSLEADGFALVDGRLDEPTCAELEAVASTATCRLTDAPGGERSARFDPDHPIAVRYDVDEQDVVDSPACQRLLADESLLAVAQRYLGAAPVQDLVAMWWSAAQGTAASSAAAQLFHFDLDRLRFVKLFVFLTDVDADTGPHVYVRGSHRDQPRSLRLDGRHLDDEVDAAFPGAATEITGPRGTMFLADTIGMHKGLALRHGHRLVFQLEWSSSLFGAPFTRPWLRSPEEPLAGALARFPRTYRRFRTGATGS